MFFRLEIGGWCNGLTPGEMARNVTPSLAKSSAYWAVNIFRAALVILYAGLGANVYLEVSEREPKLVDLMLKGLLVHHRSKHHSLSSGTGIGGKAKPAVWLCRNRTYMLATFFSFDF